MLKMVLANFKSFFLSKFVSFHVTNNFLSSVDREIVLLHETKACLGNLPKNVSHSPLFLDVITMCKT